MKTNEDRAMPTARRKTASKPKSKAVVATQVVAPTDPLKALDQEYKQKRRALEQSLKKAQRETIKQDVALARKQITLLKRKYGLTTTQIVKRLGLGQ